jgi:hypothetical protein
MLSGTCQTSRPERGRRKGDFFGDVILAEGFCEPIRRLNPFGQTTLCNTLLARLLKCEFRVAGRENGR